MMKLSLRKVEIIFFTLLLCFGYCFFSINHKKNKIKFSPYLILLNIFYFLLELGVNSLSLTYYQPPEDYETVGQFIFYSCLLFFPFFVTIIRIISTINHKNLLRLFKFLKNIQGEIGLVSLDNITSIVLLSTTGILTLFGAEKFLLYSWIEIIFFNIYWIFILFAPISLMIGFILLCNILNSYFLFVMDTFFKNLYNKLKITSIDQKSELICRSIFNLNQELRKVFIVKFKNIF